MLKYVVEFEMQNCHAYSLETFWVLLLVGNPDPKITQPSHHCVFQVPDSRHMTEGKTRFRAFCHVF